MAAYARIEYPLALVQRYVARRSLANAFNLARRVGCLERSAEAIDVAAGALAEMLLGSHYTVIVWSEDELADEMDSLIVRRLLELARQVSRTARCSLLALPQDAGRVTAKDAILWFYQPHRTSPVRMVENSWTSSRSIFIFARMASGL